MSDSLLQHTVSHILDSNYIQKFMKSRLINVWFAVTTVATAPHILDAIYIQQFMKSRLINVWFAVTTVATVPHILDAIYIPRNEKQEPVPFGCDYEESDS